MNAIVVVDSNWGIGKDGRLLCHLPGDLKYFKEKTLGKTIVYGRKTLESFPKGKPLPKRNNIVVSRTIKNQDNDFLCKNSIKDTAEYLKQIPKEDIFIAGGAKIYTEFFNHCDTFFVTKIYETFEADRYFPNLDEDPSFKVTWNSEVIAEKGIEYQFFIYERR